MKASLMRNRIIFVFLCTFVCFTFVIAEEEFVTAEAGIQISPNRFDFNAESGETKNIKINVHNYDDFSHDVEIVVEDFFVMDDTMKPQFYVPEDDHPRKAYDVINWIDVPDDFTLEGNGSKDVYFKINVPENQPTAGYYGAVFFKTRGSDVETTDENGGTGAMIKVNYRVGTLLTLAVQGDAPMKIGGVVNEFNTTKKIFWDSPIELFAKLHSTGNIHYKAGGKMEIKKFGKKFAVVKVDDEIMYPDRVRTFSEQVMFGPWDYGVYSATLDMHSEDGSVVFEDGDTTFFVIPWKTTTVIVGIIFLIIVIERIFNNKFAIIKRDKVKKKKINGKNSK